MMSEAAEGSNACYQEGSTHRSKLELEGAKHNAGNKFIHHACNASGNKSQRGFAMQGGSFFGSEIKATRGARVNEGNIMTVRCAGTHTNGPATIDEESTCNS